MFTDHDSFHVGVYKEMLKDPVLHSRWTRSPRKLEVHMSMPTREPVEEVDSPDAPVNIAMEFEDFNEVATLTVLYKNYALLLLFIDITGYYY